MFVSIVLSVLLVPHYKEVGEAITILFTELSVCLAFIYFTIKNFKVGGLRKMFLKLFISAIPYTLFIIIFKNIVNNDVTRLLSVTIVSLVWFCIYHLFVLKESYFKTYLDDFIEKKSA
jgi:O-antigen/teichoic acid export membrane protein